MISPMLSVAICVILVVWFLLPRVARLRIHTPTAISLVCCLSIFFFQAEDGIRDVAVTGVQTCALPICVRPSGLARAHLGRRVARRPIRNHKPRTGAARESWPRPAEYEWPIRAIRAIGAIDRKAEAESPAAPEPKAVAGCVAAGAPPKERIGAEGIIQGVVVVRIAEADPETVMRPVSVAGGDFPRVHDVGGVVVVEATGRVARH